MMGAPLWVVGLTTVPERRWTTLPETLASLRDAGFDRPRLFVDGTTHVDAATYENDLRLEVTARVPRVRAFSAWYLALLEMYCRMPSAQRYLVCQDDVTFVRNLRAYLDRIDFRPRMWWNLYTNAETQSVAPRDGVDRSQKVGFFQTPQNGRGALALVFDHGGVQTLLSSAHMVAKANSATDKYRYGNIDGGVVQALRYACYTELAHNPSLCEHIGEDSVIGGCKTMWPKTLSYPGADFDALTLLSGGLVGNT